MGAGFIILGCFCLFLLLCSVFLFFKLKKRGYLKTGIIISSILAAIVIVPVIMFVFESEFYSKSDVEKDLKLVNLYLKEDYEILSNEIIGMTDYYQTTYLAISESDRNRIINEIKKSKDFKILELNDDRLFYKMLKTEKLAKPKNEIWNYQSKNSFARELYHKESGYVPISITVSLKAESDTLIINRIED